MPRESPYKGLVPYEEEDAPFFFGRNSQREIIIANLMSARLTLLYGPSGVGKSSLLRAGVAHHLRQLIEQNMKERGVPEFGFVVFNSWRENPIEPLKHQITQHLSSLLPPGHQGYADHAKKSFVQCLEFWTQHLNGELYLVLDQFEEYFLYHSDEIGPDSFGSQFTSAVNASALRVNFLISIREDSLAKLDRFKGRIPRLFDNYLRIDHLDRKSATEAITGPVKIYNQRLRSPEPPVTIEPELIEAVLNQVRSGRLSLGETGRGVTDAADKTDLIETPYLQLVITRLWNEEARAGSQVMRLATLEALGNAEKIVRTHLDETLRSLSYEDVEIAARAFHYLVTPSGTKIAYSPSDLAGNLSLPKTQIESVLEQLVTGKILHKVSDPYAPARYEIFHDVLAKPILDWRSRFNLTQEILKSSIADEQRRTFRHQLRVAGALIFLIAFIALAFYAWQKRKEAIESTRKALSLELAEKATQKTGTELGVLLAKEAVLAAGTPKAEKALRNTLVEYPLVMFFGKYGELHDAAYSPDGLYIVTAGKDSIGRVWNARSGEKVAELKGHTGPLRSAVFSHNGNLIVTASEDGSARVWEWRMPYEPPKVLQGLANTVNDAEFSFDDKFVVTAGDDFDARVWDLSATDTPKKLRHLNQVKTARFSKDGNLVLTASKDGTAQIWEWKDHTEATVLKHKAALNMALFSPNEQMVATASADGPHLWNTRSGKEVPLTRDEHEVKSVAFSSDGNLLVATQDTKALIWEVPSQRVKTLQGHTAAITTSAFNQDGTLLLTAGDDNWLIVWDVQTGTVLWKVSALSIQSAEFSPDSKTVVTSSLDTAQMWRIKSSETSEGTPWEVSAPLTALINAADRRVTRNLTREEREEYLHE